MALAILAALFFLCLTKGKTYAWFHSSRNCEPCPVFEPLWSAERVSKTYAFLPNTPDADSEVRLYGTFPEDSIPASAGDLKIDIPFNLLSASTTNVQSLLDRQVSANLRLKNLLEQYLAQQKKNTEMLKGLKTPYLEAKVTRKKAVSASDAETLASTDELKRKIAEAILFQADGKDRVGLQNSPDFQTVTAEKNVRSDSVSDLEKYENLTLNEDYSKNTARTGIDSKTYGRDPELPWIFSFGLKLLRSLENNKFEILSWAAVMAVIGLVGTIVVKR